jgi:hypothetical protein
MVYAVRVLNFFASVGWGSLVGHGTKFMPAENCLGASVLN